MTSPSIAHRFRTIRHADLLGVMAVGKTVQSGPLAEALDQKGLFAIVVGMQGAG
jgi:ABC-type bacteriocin/lantibiotic exporter with double-glycine peptidase domain